eukprot:scaffold30002_cov69-Phaeocystis_antarctica.AAC.2
MHSPPPAQPRAPPRYQALAPGSARPYARRCQRQSLRPWPSAMGGCLGREDLSVGREGTMSALATRVSSALDASVPWPACSS